MNNLDIHIIYIMELYLAWPTPLDPRLKRFRTHIRKRKLRIRRLSMDIYDAIS